MQQQHCSLSLFLTTSSLSLNLSSFSFYFSFYFSLLILFSAKFTISHFPFLSVSLSFFLPLESKKEKLEERGRETERGRARSTREKRIIEGDKKRDDEKGRKRYR